MGNCGVRGQTEEGKSGWVCYLLGCADGTLYCGITNDMEKRMAAHNSGEGAKYTRGRSPVQLLYAEPCADKSAALKRELQIKCLPRSKKQAIVASAANKFHGKRRRSGAS